MPIKVDNFVLSRTLSKNEISEIFAAIGTQDGQEVTVQIFGGVDSLSKYKKTVEIY